MEMKFLTSSALIIAFLVQSTVSFVTQMSGIFGTVYNKAGEDLSALDQPDVSIGVKIKSEMICALVCTEQEDCVMYNYDRLQQKCDLFSHAPLVYGVLPESTSKRVSHLRKSFSREHSRRKVV